MKPTELELTAIGEALKGPEPWKERLRQQIRELEVCSRDETGAGFFTYFRATPDAVDDIPASAYSDPPNCIATHPAIAGGVYFLVWLKDGRIDFLEGATGAGTLPDQTGFVFHGNSQYRGGGL